MNVAIVGFDREGRASFDYFSAKGATITVCDQNPDIETPDGIPTQLGPEYLKDLDRFDIIMRTPGLHPKIIQAQNPSVQDKIWSGTNEFFKVCPTQNIIGVTGTKGKGTTSTLIATMLEAAGKNVHLAGNIGLPALKILGDVKPDDWVVLELSSFQLSDVQFSPHFAVCLMVVAEHLDWHTDFEEYVAAKANLFANQTSDDVSIYFAENAISQVISESGNARTIPYFSPPGATVDDDAIGIDGQVICKTSELKLLGEHNWQNVCAAVTVTWQIAQNVTAMREVLTTFTGLEHRLEFVRELHGVKYYDDSFGTTPETAIVAIRAFSEPKVVILGGSDKGANYEGLAKTVKESAIRKVILIGEQALRIQDALDAVDFHDYVYGGATMAEIVSSARDIAKDGDVVLLSSACASFDMFINYKDRAEKFTAAVQSLS